MIRIWFFGVCMMQHFESLSRSPACPNGVVEIRSRSVVRLKREKLKVMPWQQAETIDTHRFRVPHIHSHVLLERNSITAVSDDSSCSNHPEQLPQNGEKGLERSPVHLRTHELSAARWWPLYLQFHLWYFCIGWQQSLCKGFAFITFQILSALRDKM